MDKKTSEGFKEVNIKKLVYFAPIVIRSKRRKLKAKVKNPVLIFI